MAWVFHKVVACLCKSFLLGVFPNVSKISIIHISPRTARIIFLVKSLLDFSFHWCLINIKVAWWAYVTRKIRAQLITLLQCWCIHDKCTIEYAGLWSNRLIRNSSCWERVSGVHFRMDFLENFMSLYHLKEEIWGILRLAINHRVKSFHMGARVATKDARETNEAFSVLTDNTKFLGVRPNTH